MTDRDVPITQIFHLRLPQKSKARLDAQQQWIDMLDLCEQTPGFLRSYWGRSHEYPEHVELHVVRETLDQHQQFLSSKYYHNFLALVDSLAGSKQEHLTIQHAQMCSWTPQNRTLGRGAPFDGTAMYLKTTEAWREGSWPLWTHIVRNVDGCLGCSGGPLLGSVQTVPGGLGQLVNTAEDLASYETCFIVYVGWESTKKHHDYHHTKHFAEHSVILRCGNEGYAEYGHVVFEGTRETTGSKL